ncbi:MAG: hypothetical protein CMI02_05685, partial [Oceanospirillaceae bacterium]|nr:hypothetical protein [Oceanospirillaceae bacterium]
MTIKKALSATLFAPLLAAVISGCSDSSSSSSNVSFYVQAGQEDIEDALVRVIAVTEGGQLDQDAEGRLSGNEYITDEDGSVNPSGVIEEVYYFELVGQSEDNDTGNDPTRVRCQWADGCEADSNSYSFGTDITRTDNLGWRAIAYGLDDNERVRLTPLTDLAAQLAYDYLYDEATPGWQSTGYYSPYSVEQAISQVSQIFGIDSIESREPADLTELSGWAAESGPAAVYSIRYGALIAAWNHLAEGYSGDFTRDVAEEFSANEGQMPEDGSGVLTLNALYSAALSNLQQIETEQGISGAALTTVINDLTQEIADFSVTLTNQTPAPLQDLFGADDLDDFQLGIRRAKAFVEVMRNYQDTFFEEGYRDTIDGYMDMLKAIGDEHEDDFNTIINRYVDIKDLYLDTYLGNTGVCASTSVYAWMASASCQYDSASDTLTLTDSTGMNISVTQRVADVNTTDEDDTPSQSHAMDVLITGRYQVGGLTFLVDNTYEDDDPDEDIVSPTGIRIYYTDEVSQLADSSSNEIIGYELRWSDFAFYQADLPDVINGTDITQDDVEISGSFRIFYRGVRDPLDDPQNPVTDLRFNIDTVVLNGRVSDVIGDDNDDDNDYTTVYVAASAANASDYYPEDEWSSFNGFFNP